LAAEQATHATLSAVLAAAQETPEAKAIAAAEAAAATSTEALAALETSCAAQRAEMGRLQNECGRLGSDLIRTRHDLAQLESRVRVRVDGLFDSAGGGAAMRSTVSRAAHVNPADRTITTATVRTDTRAVAAKPGGGGAPLLSTVTRTLVQQHQQQPPPPPRQQQHTGPVFDIDMQALPAAPGGLELQSSAVKKRRRRSPLVLDSESDESAHRQGAVPAPPAPPFAAAAAPAKTPRKPVATHQQTVVRLPLAGHEEDPWGSR
jgi:hypothetical protein